MQFIKISILFYQLLHILPMEETKHPGGRPLKFQSVKELQEKIDDYFETTSKDERTITGLALHLDTFRSVLCDYEQNRDEFSYAIKKAKQKVENWYEIDLKKHWRTWTIFALKNFDWKDKSEVAQETTATIKIEQVQTMSDEDLLALTK